MPDTPAFLAERLRSDGEKFFAIFENLTDAQWQTEVYTEGTTWTIRNVLAHFVTAERGFLKLFENVLLGGLGSSEDFSIDRYNASQQEKIKTLTPAELLAQYKAVRAEMIAWVSARTEDELQIEGRHPFLGQVALAEMIKMVYRHNQIHYRDFRKLLE
ncbi:MAG: hypothetical protein Kow002_21190 [Anaerolineales bacterium]